MNKYAPGSQLVAIEDCRSAIVQVNPSPRCPHDKVWRESDYLILTPAQRKERCLQTECAAVEYRPHEGERIVLKVPRTLGARRPLTQMIINTLGGDGFEGNLRGVLEQYVTGWTWTGRTDDEADNDVDPAPLPLPSADWERVADCLSFNEMMWIVNAVLAGGDPAGKAATEGKPPAA